MKNKTLEQEIVRELSNKYGKKYEIESEPENYIHEGLNNAEFLSHFQKDLLTALTRVREEEREKYQKIVEIVEGLVNGNAFDEETGLIWQHWLDEAEKALQTLNNKE